MQPRSVPLGTVIAERQFSLYDQAGTERRITVRLARVYRPQQVEAGLHLR